MDAFIDPSSAGVQWTPGIDRPSADDVRWSAGSPRTSLACFLVPRVDRV